MSQSAAYRFGHFMGRLPRPVRLSLFLIVSVGIVWPLVPSDDVSKNTAASNAHVAVENSNKASITPQPSNVAEVKQRTPAEKKAQQEKWFGSSTIVAAKRAVKASLKDPGSAEFKGVYANYTEEYGVVACGYVNAKNSFGGYTGYKAFVSSGQSVILEGRDQLTKAWRGACNTRPPAGQGEN